MMQSVQTYLKPPNVSIREYLASIGPGKPVAMHFHANWHTYSSPAFSQMFAGFDYHSVLRPYCTDLAFVKIDTEDPQYDAAQWRLDMRGTSPTFMAFDEEGEELFATTKNGFDAAGLFLEKFMGILERRRLSQMALAIVNGQDSDGEEAVEEIQSGESGEHEETNGGEPNEVNGRLSWTHGEEEDNWEAETNVLCLGNGGVETDEHQPNGIEEQ